MIFFVAIFHEQTRASTFNNVLRLGGATSKNDNTPMLIRGDRSARAGAEVSTHFLKKILLKTSNYLKRFYSYLSGGLFYLGLMSNRCS